MLLSKANKAGKNPGGYPTCEAACAAIPGGIPAAVPGGIADPETAEDGGG